MVEKPSKGRQEQKMKAYRDFYGHELKNDQEVAFNYSGHVLLGTIWEIRPGKRCGRDAPIIDIHHKFTAMKSTVRNPFSVVVLNP